jgi:TonB family protein
MKIIFALFTAVVLGISAWIGHSSTPITMHKFHGTIKDSKGAVIAGLSITTETPINGQRSTATDLNGDFYMELPTGDHVIKIDSAIPYDLRAFIKITEEGPNPDNVEFIVDTSRVCCTTSSGQPFAKPTSLPRPAYPAAARAVRAGGEVVVRLTLNEEGKVLSAKALSGHPLLKASSEGAARGSRYEPSEQKEREVLLVYVYIPNGENSRNGVIRYTNPYRIEMIAAAQTIVG